MSASPQPAIASRFTVLLLGTFGVLQDGVALDTSSWPRRSQTLLKLLATAHGGRRLRDELVDLLWPEADPEAGARNLRYVLHVLRRNLGGGDPSPILSEREWIGLNPGYGWEIDLRQLEEGAAQANGDLGALERAAALYRGEALPEDRYEDWSVGVRERAERLWRSLGLQLARAYRERGAQEKAAVWAECLLEHDPLDEEALQELIQALEVGGRRADAVRRFGEFERRLADELGVSPSLETAALFERLKTAPGPALETPRTVESAAERPPPVGGFLGALPANPILGREEELARLAAAAEAVQAGAGRLLLVVGEAGIGKTRLAQEGMVRLTEASFLVLTSRCYESERAVALSPFVAVLARACASLPAADRLEVPKRWPSVQRLLSGQLGPVAGVDRLQVARELTAILARLADERPMALLLDDLHHADEASLSLLQHLARHTRAYRVLILGTYTDAEVAREHPLLGVARSLDREGLVERLTLRRLTEESIGAVVAATVGELEGATDFVEFVQRRTKGNPFYVYKMLQALDGHYRLVRQLGAGGMGRVFETVDTITGDRVAAKIMFARTEAEPKAMQRFEQESAVLATLDHPNIVRVHDSFVEENASCIVMELLEGRPLGRLLAAEKLDLARTKRLAEQVAAALECAHGRGIVHRDIKPDNIMVLGHDQVKVTDFGIARLLRPIEAVATMTSTGMTMGTPLYMAPEQIEGKQVDGRTDIYALGCVLYQMVTGQPPFEGEDPLTVAIKHVRETPRPPRELNQSLPKDWERLILRALAKDPADRFPSAAALHRTLLTLPEGTGESTGLARRLARSLSIRTVAGAAAAALLVAVLAYRFGTSFSTSAGVSLGRPVGSWSLPPASPALFKQPVSLAVDRQGAFYVLDRGTGRVLHVSATGTPLGSWGGLGSAPGQLRDPRALALDRAGNVYVADSGNDRIQKFSPTGRMLAVWGRTGSGLGEFRFPDGIAVDRQGSIYVADWGNNRIEVLDRSGHPKATSVGSFTALYTGLNHPEGIAVDANGELYVADNGNNQIVAYGPTGVLWLAQWYASGDPTGIALDAHGNVYVTDAQGSKVQRFSSSGTPLASWSGRGKGSPQFQNPEGVAVDARGVAYLADSGDGRILRLASTNRWLPAWRGQLARARLPVPDALAVDRRGDVYVVDTANSRILTLSPSGQWLGSEELAAAHLPFAFLGPIGGIAVDAKGDPLVTDYGSNDVLKRLPEGWIIAASAPVFQPNPSGPELTNPQGVAVDRRGNIYVADQGNSRIQQFSARGELHAVWRISGSAAGTQPYMYGVAVDRHGYVYVTDELGDHVLKLSPHGSLVSQWGSRGSGPGQLRAPQGIAVDDRSGRVYVVDTDNKRIQMFSLAGKYLGSSLARFVRPTNVAVGGQGNVYVTDAGSRRLEKFSP